MDIKVGFSFTSGNDHWVIDEETEESWYLCNNGTRFGVVFTISEILDMIYSPTNKIYE